MNTDKWNGKGHLHDGTSFVVLLLWIRAVPFNFPYFFRVHVFTLSTCTVALLFAYEMYLTISSTTAFPALALQLVQEIECEWAENTGTVAFIWDEQISFHSLHMRTVGIGVRLSKVLYLIRFILPMCRAVEVSKIRLPILIAERVEARRTRSKHAFSFAILHCFASERKSPGPVKYAAIHTHWRKSHPTCFWKDATTVPWKNIKNSTSHYPTHKFTSRDGHSLIHNFFQHGDTLAVHRRGREPILFDFQENRTGWSVKVRIKRENAAHDKAHEPLYAHEPMYAHAHAAQTWLPNPQNMAANSAVSDDVASPLVDRQHTFCPPNVQRSISHQSCSGRRFYILGTHVIKNVYFRD